MEESNGPGQPGCPPADTILASEPPGRVSLPGPRGITGGQPSPSLTGEAVPRDELVSALASLADRAIGGSQVFATLTFRDPAPVPGSPLYSSIGHGGAVRKLTRYLGGVAEVYPGISAFFAMEPHADRVAPHFHGLLGGLDPGVAAAIDRGRRGDLAGSRGRETGQGGAATGIGQGVGVMQARERFWHAWWTANGMARLEKIDGDGASLYVAKYSLKGASEVPWWRIWEPGELRNQWVASSRSRRPHR